MKTNKILLTIYVVIAIAVIHHYVTIHNIPDKAGQEIFIPDNGTDIPSTFRDIQGSDRVEPLVAYKQSGSENSETGFSSNSIFLKNEIE